MKLRSASASRVGRRRFAQRMSTRSCPTTRATSCRSTSRPPLLQTGDAVRRGWEEWFPTFRGPIGYEIRDLSITVGDDVAFSHSLNRISGTRTSGEDADVWVRPTVCYRKTDGKWMVAHEHVSVPFYMDGSNRAAVDLRP